MPASGHFDMVHSLMTKASQSGKSVSVILLQYELAPTATYPRQYEQANELLRYVTTDLAKFPDKIMLVGDSSGGNMILGILSHLMHPHPSLRPLKLSGPLKGALLSSPVTVLNTKNEKFRQQESQDPAPAAVIDVWMKNFLGKNKPDKWNEASTQTRHGGQAWIKSCQKFWSRWLLSKCSQVISQSVWPRSR